MTYNIMSQKIYTRTGDNGNTRLGNGQIVGKDSLRIEALGTIDELSSVIGMVLSYPITPEVKDCLVTVQHMLLDLGRELAVPDTCLITAIQVTHLETVIDTFAESLPPLKGFILPVGSPAVTTCHLARTVCRRTERCMVALMRVARMNKESLKYLNRLGDLLFVIAEKARLQN